MRALAAVFAREIHARRLVFPVALGAGFTPLLVSLVTGWSKPGAADMRLIVAFVAAAAFTLAFALLFGGSVLAAETSEKRISFFFSRPIPAGAIWGGKLLAALFLSFVPAFLVLTPAALTGSVEVRTGPGLWIAAILLAVCALFLVLGAHTAVTIARLRSPWIALDAVFAGLSALGMALSARALVRDGVVSRHHILSSGPLWTLFTLVAAFGLAATYAQVAVGRTDARRAHGAFSATLWSLVGSSVLVLCGYAVWVASARASDLSSIDGTALAAPRGSWIAAGGPLRAGRGGGLFLVDTAGVRSLRVRSGDAAFSANGERAAWTEERVGFLESERRSDVFVADLSAAKAVETGLATSVWSRAMLSPSGRRLGILDGKTLAAYDVADAANPKQRAAFPISDGSRGFAFVGEDTIRLFPRFYNPVIRKDVSPPALEITELSLVSKKSLVTGRFDRETLPYLRLAADGRFFVGTRRVTEDPGGTQGLTLHDGRTGTLLATLSEDLESPKLRFLSGERTAVAGVAHGKGVLKIFLEGEGGKASSSFELGPAASVVLGGEVAPGRVAVALNPFRSNDGRSRSAWKLVFVDVATGAVSSGPDGLVPADRLAWWLSPTLPPAEAGSPASFLFLDPDSRLVRLDPATGAQTVLLGRSK